MFLRSVVLILLIILLFSCDTTSYNTTTAKSNFQVLDTVINFTSVEAYPLFTECENGDDKRTQKECFEATMVRYLSNSLKKVDYRVKQSVNDSSSVNLLVNKNGKTKVVSIESPQIILKNLPQLDSIIRLSVDALPIVKPAYKRGIPVKSQYKLAIVVKTN